MTTAAPLVVPPPEEVAAVAQLLREEALERTPPGPSAAEWLRAVAASLREWLSGLAPWGGSLATLFGEILLWTVLGAGALTLGWLLFLALRRGTGRSRRQPADVSLATATPEGTEARSVTEWRSLLEQRLAGGDASGAIEALWWVLLLSAGASLISREITGRNLLQRVGRVDLLPLVSRLEAMTYGRSSPPLEQVRALAGQVDGAVVERRPMRRAR